MLNKLSDSLVFHQNIFLYLLSAISVVVIVLNVTIFKSPILGFPALLFFLLINGFLTSFVFRKFLSWESKFITIPLAMLSLIFLFGVIGWLIIAIYKLTVVYMLCIFAFMSIISIFIHHLCRENYVFQYQSVKNHQTLTSLFSSKRVLYLLVLLFFILEISGSMVLIGSRSDDTIKNLWDHIPRLYIYLYLVSTVLCASLIFSKLGTKAKLMLIMIHGLFLMSYFGLIYGTGYGGDTWDMMARANEVMKERGYGFTLFPDAGLGPKWASLGPLELPHSFISRPYDNYIAVLSSFSWVTSVDVFWLTLLINPILYGLFIPIILYQTGSIMVKNNIYRLLLSFSPSLFYFIIIFGSHTLAFSFSAVFLLFSILLWINYLQNPNKKSLVLASLITIGLFCGYTLMFLISAFIAIASLAISRMFSTNILQKHFTTRLSLSIFSIVVLLSWIIPYLDMTRMGTRIENLSPSFIAGSAINWIKDNSGLTTFFSPYYSWSDPVYLVSVKNVNTTSYAFGSGDLRALIVLSLWFLVLLGVFYLSRKSSPKVFSVLFSLLLITQLNTFVTWYLETGGFPMIGNRLDLPREFFMLFFVAAGLLSILEKTVKHLNRFMAPLVTISFRVKYLSFRVKYLSTNPKLIATLMLILYLSVASTSAYTMNPRATNVSSNVVDAAEFVSDYIRFHDGEKCIILSNNLFLRVFEKITGNDVMGGNWIVKGLSSQIHTQMEQLRDSLFNEMINSPNESIILEAMNHTNSDTVFFISDMSLMTSAAKDSVVSILGEPMNFTGMYVYKVTRSPFEMSINGLNSTLLTRQDALLLGFNRTRLSVQIDITNQDSISSKLINPMDSVVGWNIIVGAGELVEDNNDKVEGKSSLHASNGLTVGANGSASLIYTYVPTDSLNMDHQEFIEVWTKSNTTGNLYVSIRTDNNNYLRWWGKENSYYTIFPNIWQRWVLPINNPTAKQGDFQLNNVTAFIIGIRELQTDQLVDFKIDGAQTVLGSWVSVEFNPLSFSLKNFSYALYSWSGQDYLPIIKWNNDQIISKMGNGYLLNKMNLSDIFNTQFQWLTVYPSGSYGEIKLPLFGEAKPIVYQFGNNTSYDSIGFAIKLPPSTNNEDLDETGGMDKIRLMLDISVI